MNSVILDRIATCCGVGRIKICPGTIASFLALIFLLDNSTWRLQLALIIIIFFVGVKSADAVIKRTGNNDPSEVVIDEVCGILVTFFLIKANWQLAIIGFFLFRLFDIVKPFPVYQFEKLPRGWGVMADDVAAGLCANAILQYISYIFIK